MIFLQLKRFMHLSKYVPIVSKILTIVLIIATILGYVLIFVPDNFLWTSDNTNNNRPDGVFDTY